MFCKYCGTQVQEGAKFCPKCGNQLGATNPPGGFGGQAGLTPPPPAGNGPKSYGTPVNSSRSLLTWAVLTILTCGIYGYYFTYSLAQDLNTMCEGDGERTPGLLEFILISFITCGFYAYYWYYKIGNRLQTNAPRYGLSFTENGTTILIWQIFGALLCCIGPFIAMNIIIRNTNAMASAYNARLGYR